MTENIKIQLSDRYQPVTEADIRTAKNFVLRRESCANGLAYLVEGLLEDAAETITQLCYSFNVDPRTFQISSVYNSRLYELISKVLDQLEDDIWDLMMEYSMKCTESEKKRLLLLPWIATLGYKRKTLRQILEKRLWNFSRDLEAMIIAERMAKRDVVKAVSRIRSNLKSVYTIPEMKVAFAHAAEQKNIFIRTHGVKHGNVGNSNSEAVNIERLVRMTVQQTWMHQYYENAKEKDAFGYMVLRGSNFDCPICDAHTGTVWAIDNVEHYPPFHANCCCYVLPVYYKKEEQNQ